jgi:hypothetical protein
MKLFGFEITRIKKTKTKTQINQTVTFEYWMKKQIEPVIYFRLPYRFADEKGFVVCYVSCKHQANSVQSESMVGASLEEAFEKALSNIELTIGQSWREEQVQIEEKEQLKEDANTK